ncbi:MULTISPECIES: hypothetical protein [Streptosporangium]|uniref:Uncharacterized protein n=1 Tax=Streptosporangium jomthongense TaxID=1193683 RepID=A0ABV8FBD9_9ACTN
MTAITFDHTNTSYNLAHARCLAHAAALAYKDEADVTATVNGRVA